MDTISENKCFEGTQGVYRHESAACGCDMTFGLFLPKEARQGPVPVLWYLSGLTCTHENAMVKAGAQAFAAENGIALIFPDTSPRGQHVAVMACLSGSSAKARVVGLCRQRLLRVNWKFG